MSEEFSFEAYPFDYTDKGRLMGHLVLGAEMIQEKIKSLPGFPEDISIRLQSKLLRVIENKEIGNARRKSS